MKKTMAAFIIAAVLGFALGGIAVAEDVFNIKTVFWSDTDKTVSNNTEAGDKQAIYSAANSDSGQTYNVADLVEQASPAVVNIEVQTAVTNPMMNDPFYRQFFGGNLGNKAQIQKSIGTGFIISSDGCIITNQHVVDAAQSIMVTVPGSEEQYEAAVIGEDYDLDLAVIKIEGTDYPTLALGISKAIRVGESVIAIGQPYGLDHTVTTGVISAKERPISIEDRNYTNLIQTDAAINPGNSGGPLLNMQGQVIGINTAISTEAQGIGFAIPIDTVTEVLDNLLAGTKTERPYLGVYMSDVGQEVIQQMDLPYGTTGALIAEVVDGSPADSAGLLPMDIITSLGGQKTISAADLQSAVRSHQAGDKVKIVLLRDGDEIQVNVQLQAK